MEHAVGAPRPGRVTAINVGEGDQVTRGDVSGWSTTPRRNAAVAAPDYLRLIRPVSQRDQPVTTAATPTVDPAAKLAEDAAFGPIFRDIARGGITGLIVGLVGVGIGGRIVMRLAALLVPELVGEFTENGFRIGDITPGGSLGLVVFGMFAGAGVATIWVTVSPWIPGTGIRRALLAMPVAVGLGAFALIDGGNRDFFILRNDSAVSAVLIVAHRRHRAPVRAGR